MSELHHSDTALAEAKPPLDARAVMAALRQAGAAQWDPVRLHYLQALAQRADAETGRVKELLEARLDNAVAAFKARFESRLERCPRCRGPRRLNAPASRCGVAGIAQNG